MHRDANGDTPKYVAPELSYLLDRIVNVCFIGPPGATDRGWTLVDCGLPGSASKIKRAAARHVRRGLAAGGDRADARTLRPHRRRAHARARVGRARVRARARAAVPHGAVVVSAARSARRRRRDEPDVRALSQAADRSRPARPRAARRRQRARRAGLALDPDARVTRRATSPWCATPTAPSSRGTRSRRRSRNRSSPR